MKNVRIFSQKIDTPLGEMLAVASDEKLYMLDFADQNLEKKLSELKYLLNGEIVEQPNRIITLLEKELNLYFQGNLKDFTVPLQLSGTEFQTSVWQSLQTIPYGKLWSYKEQAIALGNEKKVRAVATANGKNKIAIIIPCHRVVGSNGKLTGYSGGIWRKEKLLQIENALLT